MQKVLRENPSGRLFLAVIIFVILDDGAMAETKPHRSGRIKRSEKNQIFVKPE